MVIADGVYQRTPEPLQPPPDAEPLFAATPAPDGVIEIYRVDYRGQVAPGPYRRLDGDDDSFPMRYCRLLPLANGGWGIIGAANPDARHRGGDWGLALWPHLDAVYWPDVAFALPAPGGVRMAYWPAMPQLPDDMLPPVSQNELDEFQRMHRDGGPLAGNAPLTAAVRHVV